MKVKAEFKIIIIYIVIGFSWIMFSDKLLNSLTFNQVMIDKIQTVKGFIYVLVTGIIFYFLIHHVLENVRNSKQKVKQKNQELKASYEEIKVLNASLQETHGELKATNEELLKNTKKYRGIFDNAPLAIIIWDKNYEIINWNDYAKKMFGWSKEEMVGSNLVEMLVPPTEFNNTSIVKKGVLKDINAKNINKNLTKNGQIITCEWHNEPLYDENGSIDQVISIAKDITQEKELKQELQEKEKRYRTLFESTGTATLIIAEDSTIELTNKRMEEVTGYSKAELIGEDYSKFIANDQDLKRATEYHRQRKAGNEDSVPDRYEVCIINKQGEIRDELVQAALIPGTKKVVVSLTDITRRKRAEEKVRYISYHDYLTGLYNRKYYEQELERLDTQRQLPFSIIVGDINRLKLTNDIFGHEAGDNLLKEAADILEMSTREEDIIARWGGDEFGIILPQTSNQVAKEIIERIKDNCKKVDFEFIPLQIALGCATKVKDNQEIEDIFKEAEDEMYRDKQQKSGEDEYLLTTLVDKIRITDYDDIAGHTFQMVQLAKKLGLKMNLLAHEREKLNLLTRFHDIGKIAIANKILNNEGNLKEKEWGKFKEHSEIGYDVAKAFEKLSPIANDILYHHERWDGKGYPKGLRKEEIPLLSRIVHIIDFFDGVTSDIYYPINNDKYYKKSISSNQAVKEINKYSGILFDPNYVQVFTELIEKDMNNISN